jgi:hypothetical protein
MRVEAVMPFYAFLTEPAPPRTIFREQEVEVCAEDGDDVVQDLLDVVMSALEAFPEAYRAAVRAMEESRGLGKRGP